MPYAERWGERANYQEASADIDAKLFVKDGALCGLGIKADGVSVADIEDEKPFSLHVTGDVNVTGSGTVTAGDDVTSNATGNAIKKYADSVKVIKAADESKTEDTTLADDAELKQLAVAAGLIYAIKGAIKVANADSGSARSLKYTLSVPTGASVEAEIKAATDVAGNMTLVDSNADMTGTKTQEIATSGEGFIGFEGHLDMGTAANGLCGLQWAANASVTSLLTILDGSWLEVSAVTPQKKNGTAMTTAIDGDVLVRLGQ